jgi:hypothetical protein
MGYNVHIRTCCMYMYVRVCICACMCVCVCVAYPETSLPMELRRLPNSDPTTDKKLSEKQYWFGGRTNVRTVRT